MAGILNIQIKPALGKKEVNLKKVEHYLRKSSENTLDLVVLPEFFSTGIDHEIFKNSPEDETGGETIERISKLAKEFNTNIVAGTVIEKSENKLYNTSFIINRKGETVGKYRKIHLFNYMGGTEGDIITPGDKPLVVDLDFAKVGVGICYDIRYPNYYRELAKQGAEIIVLPTAWVVPNEVYNSDVSLKYAQDMWIAMNRTRAFDNLVYTITCNQTKECNDKVCAIGNSLIISPTTAVLANGKDEQGATFADIDLEIVKYYKSIYPIAEID